MDAEALDQRLHREGRLAIQDAMEIARQIAERLKDAHARGVLHRNLKPDNILIDRTGYTSFRNFGMAPAMASNDVPGSGLKTDVLEYLSPEQVRDDTVGVYTDLYALGLILYEMLIGSKPFGSVFDDRGQAARMFDGPPSVRKQRPEVPLWLDRLVDRLLCPKPEHRVHSAAEVVSAIDRCAVLPPLWLVRLQPRHMGWVGNSVVVLLALAVGVAAWQFSQYRVSASAPPLLQRVLVQPIERQGGEATLDDRIAGLSAHLRDALGARVAVVDGEHTERIMRWLYFTDRTPHDPAARREAEHSDDVTPPKLATLRTISAANRVLQPRLIAEGGRWRLQADLYTDAPKPQRIDGMTAADPIAALGAGLPTLAAALGLREADLNLALPDHIAALDAYGAALRTRWRYGPGQPAVAALRRVTQIEPGYAAAWVALAEAAQAASEDPIAYEAIARGQRVVAKAPKPLQARFEAVHALLDGDAPTAIAQWHALSTAMPDDSFAALNLARAQAAGGDLNTAVTGLRTLTARDQNDPRAWYELGKLAILQGDAHRAITEYLPRALLLYQNGRDDYGQGETLNALGVSYRRLGQTGNAEAQYQKAVELRRRIGNRRGIADSLYNLAAVAGLRGKLELATKYLDEAHTLYSALGDRQGLAAVESQIGQLAWQRGEFRAALAAYRRALTARQQIGDAPGEAVALNSIGASHYRLGDYASAQAYWQQAAQAYGRLGDAAGGVRIELNLGVLATAQGRWDEARRRLTQSLSAAQKRKMLSEVALTRRNLAELELWQGHLSAAFVQMAMAEALFRQYGDRLNLIDTRLLRAQALLAAGADTAAQQLLNALEETLPTASHEHRAIAATLRAELAQHQGNPRRVADALTVARRFADTSGSRRWQLQIELLATRSQSGDLAALDTATAALGHTGLRLAFLELALSRALEAGDGAAAVSLYGQAQTLLGGSDYLRAPQLHTLGAKALAASGDAEGADEARRVARKALKLLRAQIPAATRADSNAASGVIRAVKPASPKRSD